MKNMQNTTRGIAAAAAAGLALAAAGGLGGCRGERTEKPPRQFIPDMDDSPKFKNQTGTAFFEDGRMMRPRVRGTVAFGERTDGGSVRRARYLRDDEKFVYSGIDPAGEKTAEGDPFYITAMPAEAIDAWMADATARGHTGDPAKPGDRQAALAAMLDRGQGRFDIFCSACHGYEGDGRGLVGVRWGSPVPSFHDPKYKDAGVKTGRDGYMFHTILNGVPNAVAGGPPKMPSYADKVSAADAWAIVAYVRALQASRPTTSAAAATAAQPVAQPVVEGVTK